MSARNGGRPMVNWWIRFISPLVRSWTGGRVRVIFLFCRRVSIMIKRSGCKYTASYLKNCAVYLQQSVGGMIVKDCSALGAKVGRTRGGLPVWIDSRDRVEIRKGNRTIIRIWFTLFSLYRVLEWPMTMKPSKLSTIVEPGKPMPGDLIVELGRFFSTAFWPELQKVVGKTTLLSSIHELTPRGKPPLWTKLCSTLTAKPYLIPKVSATSRQGSPSTSLQAMVDAAASWKASINRKLFDILRTWCSQTGNLTSKLIPKREQRFLGGKTKVFSLMDGLESLVYLGKASPTLGRLALKREPAGKIRVFAMVDCFTQWLLKPLHKMIFKTLARIPQDGTFDQLAPVHRLRKKSKTLYSYDLSAATDRLPVQVQEQLLHRVLGLHGAWHWRELLVNRLYGLPKGVKVHFTRTYKKFYPNPIVGREGRWIETYVDEYVDKILYAVGQPMGALSSWAMLALTHHALVQFAYYRVLMRMGLPYRWFNLYAILGDDIVIGSPAVAAEYEQVMTELGVKIGLAKSLISFKGVCEFAKRFFTPKGDASPIPVKESLSALSSLPSLVEFVRKYRLSPPQVMKFSGYGHKRIGGTTSPLTRLPSKARVILLALSHPRGAWPLSITRWLGMRALGVYVPLKPSFWDWFKDQEIKRLDSILKSWDDLRDYLLLLQRWREPKFQSQPMLDKVRLPDGSLYPEFVLDHVYDPERIANIVWTLADCQIRVMELMGWLPGPTVFYEGEKIQDSLDECSRDWEFNIRPKEHRSIDRMKSLALHSIALAHHDRPPSSERGRKSGPVKVNNKPAVGNLASQTRRIIRLIDKLRNPTPSVVHVSPLTVHVPVLPKVEDMDKVLRGGLRKEQPSKGLKPIGTLSKVISRGGLIEQPSEGLKPEEINFMSVKRDYPSYQPCAYTSVHSAPISLPSTSYGIDWVALRRARDAGVLDSPNSPSDMLKYQGVDREIVQSQRWDVFDRVSHPIWENFVPDHLLTSRVDPVTGRRMPPRESRKWDTFQDPRVWLPLSNPSSLWNGWYDWSLGSIQSSLHGKYDDIRPIFGAGPEASNPLDRVEVPQDGALVVYSQGPQIFKGFEDLRNFRQEFVSVFGYDGFGLLVSPLPSNKKLFLAKYGKILKSLHPTSQKSLLRWVRRHQGK